jgi:transcriptional regulator with XRE-family HTH domain
MVRDPSFALIDRMRAIRKKMGLTQLTLAMRMGCCQQRISGVENYRQTLNFNYIKDFCKTMGVTIEFKIYEHPELLEEK